MAFFHNREVSSSKATRQQKLPKRTLREHGCKLCPLNEACLQHPKMEAEGPQSSKLMIIGNRPSKADDKNNRHFSGETGSLLFEVLPSEWHEEAVFDFINRCHSTTMNEEQKSVQDACCSTKIEDEIYSVKPKVVIALGNDVLRWFGASPANTTLWRGRHFPARIKDHCFWVFPTYDLVEVRKDFKTTKSGKEMPGAYYEFLTRDIQTAISFTRNSAPVAHVIGKDEIDSGCEWILGKGMEDFDRLCEWRDELLKHSEISVDLECTELRPYSKGRILTAAVSVGDKSYAFPLSHKNGWRLYSPEYEEEAYKVFREILMHPGARIYHNAMYDLEWEAVNIGDEILFPDKVSQHCTQVSSYIIDSRKGMLSLDVLVFQNFGFWLKQLSKIDYDHMEKNDYKNLLRYNALDAKYTLLLHRENMKVLEAQGLVDLYRRKASACPALVRAQIRGIMPNMPAFDRLEAEYTAELAGIESKFNAMPEVEKFRRRFGHPLVLTAPEDIGKFLFTFYGQEQLKSPGGKFNTDEEALSAIKKEVPLVTDILKHRSLSKLLSTYVTGMRAMIHGDGLIHTSYRLTHTSTSRLSSQDPNSQNFPKRKNKQVREIIGAPEGFLIGSNDYGQIEARVFAMASEDREFTKSLWSGLDVHRDWALRIINAYPDIIDITCDKYDLSPSRTPEEKIIKTFRGDVKNSWVFPQFFGSSPLSCAKNLKIPENVASKLAKEFWDMFIGVKKWQEKTTSFYRKHGYVETLTGFRRYGPLGYNEQINTPIQGTAAEIVLTAMSQLSRQSLIDKSKWFLQPCLNIHDDITLYYPIDNVGRTLDTIARVMCSKEFSPFDFINVPLVAEMEAGLHWAAQKSIGEYHSNKGWIWNTGTVIDCSKDVKELQDLLAVEKSSHIVFHPDDGDIHDLLCSHFPDVTWHETKDVSTISVKKFINKHTVIVNPVIKGEPVFDNIDLASIRAVSKKNVTVV